MKSTYLLLICVVLTLKMSAQCPQKMSYQAVIRDATNALVTSSPVGMRISILSGSPTGPVIFSETHSAATNSNGLVSIEIGNGALVSGSFALINWATNTCFLKMETDPTGGTSYTITGTSQLLSVPYALYAERTGPQACASDADCGPGFICSGSGYCIPALLPGTNIGDMLYWNGIDWTILPAGTPGQTLKANASNIPQWQTETSFGGKTYVIVTGNTTDSQAASQLANELGPNTQFIWVQNTTNLTTLDLSGVTDLIELKINSNSALTNINLNGLTNITNVLSITSNPVLANLTLPSLISNRGTFSCNLNNNLVSLSLPALLSNTFSFDCQSNNMLSTISLPLVSFVGQFSCSGNSSLTSLTLPALASANNGISVSGNSLMATISLPSLVSAGGIGCGSNASLMSFTLPSLVTCNGTFVVANNALLSNLTLPALDTCRNEIVCFSNPMLTSLSFPSLSHFSGTNFHASYNALTGTTINNLLAMMVSWGSTPMLFYIALQGQTPPAPPTGPGITDKATLIAAGKTVDTD